MVLDDTVYHQLQGEDGHSSGKFLVNVCLVLITNRFSSISCDVLLGRF